MSGFAALGLDYYGPVSGNWCWVRPRLLLQRYILTHGWRIGIFFITVGIYIAIYVSLKRTYGRFILLTSAESRGDGTSQTLGQSQLRSHADVELFDLQDARGIAVQEKISVTVEDDVEHSSGGGSNHGHYSKRNAVFFAPGTGSRRLFESTVGDEPAPPIFATRSIDANTERAAPSSTSAKQHKSSTDAFSARRRQVRRILLLNGYPIMYIVLWIPGIVNRLVESVDGSTPLWLAALQSSTQFIGLANALTYGWNEGLRNQLAMAWGKRTQGRHVRV